MLSYWFLLRPHTVGVKCVLRHQDEILLIKNSYGWGLWTLPSGGVKRGESSEEAVVREVEEEVGIRIEVPKNCGSILDTRNHRHDTVWVFVSELKERKFSIDHTEIAEAQWFRIDAMPEAISPLLRDSHALVFGSSE